MARRKPSPLQVWRAEYNYLARTIASAKRGHIWGTFKQPAAQSIRARLRVLAREQMALRPEAQRLAQQLWEANHKNANVPNTHDPLKLVATHDAA